jgi:DNA-binding PadR family transcriptional regulator
MGPGQEPAEIVKDLSRKPHRILISIQNRGGTVKKSLITDDTDIGSSLANYHLTNLMGAGLVKRTDEDEHDGIPREGYTYQITEKGEEVLKVALEDYETTPVESRDIRRRFEKLEARTESLEQQNQKLVEKVGKLTEENERLEGRIDNMRDANSKLWEDVQSLK